MKRIVFTLSAVIASFLCFSAPKGDYAASNIDPALLANADAVYRISDEEVEIKSPSEVMIRKHYAVTVLNKRGAKYASCSESFSKLETVEKLRGYIYDKDGALKQKIKESDFGTIAVSLKPGYYDDDKAKEYNCSIREYPYTVEFFTETRQTHTFFLPEWIVRPAYDVAVEESHYRLTAPSDFKIRYKSFNATLNADISKDEDKNVYSWTSKDIKAERPEFLVSEEFEGSPVLMIAPEEFILGTYKGNMSSWKSFGKFLYDLNKDRDELTEDKKAEILQLIQNVTDPNEKISILYKYLQEHVRYVSIQYGVGGWQTLDAKFVCSNGYGDCKALSNFMYSILKVAGITAYPVVIYAGTHDAVKMPLDFVEQVFNHVILCVPLQKDTVWLECTSRDFPAGYLGSFTADRDALMVTPEGGVVVHTPGYGLDVNVIAHKITGILNTDGSMNLQMNNFYSGIPAEGLIGWSYLNEQEKDRFINSKFQFPSYTTTAYDLVRTDKAFLLHLNEKAGLAVQGAISKMGDYQLLNIDLDPVRLPFQIEATERKKSFYLPACWQILDTFEITLPPAASVKALPEDMDAPSPFGECHWRIEERNGKLFAARTIQVNQGEYKAEQYSDYEAWIDKLHSQRYYKVVLQSK
jgi:hypothetical protein